MSDEIWRIQRQIDNQGLAVTEVEFAGASFVVRMLAPGKFTANALGEDALPSRTAFVDLAGDLLRKGYLPATRVSGAGKNEPVNKQYRSSNREAHPVTTADRPGMTSWAETALPWVEDPVRMFAAASPEQTKLGVVLSEDSLDGMDDTRSSYLKVPDVGMDMPFDGVSLMYNKQAEKVAVSLLYSDPDDLIKIRAAPEECPAPPPPVNATANSTAAGRKLMADGADDAPKEGDLRILADAGPPFNSQFPWRGELEMYRSQAPGNNSGWFFVCNGGWDDADAAVACRQMGYVAGKVASALKCDLPGECFTGTADRKENQGELVFSGFAAAQLGCTGDEQTLLDCPGDPGPIFTAAQECFALSEARIQCSVALDVRLVGGSVVNQGRVEVRQEGTGDDEWGTVCTGQMNREQRALTAQTACKQLGYRGGVAMEDAAFGEAPESLAIRTAELACDGTERNLGQCQQYGYNENLAGCRHSKDLSVACYADTFEADAVFNAIRLADGGSSAEGRVEVYHDKVWGPLCGLSSERRGWTDEAASSVCHELGFPLGGWASGTFGDNALHSFVDPNDKVQVAGGPGPMWLGDYACTGTENNFRDCELGEFEEQQNAGLCAAANDGSSTSRRVAGANCFTETDVRLADGADMSQGRLEVRSVATNGEWSTVCNDGFDDDDAKVVCRQLGFRGGFFATQGTFAEGEGDVQLSKVACSGEEAELGLCRVDDFRPNTGCPHSQDAGVVCYNAEDEPDMRPGAVRLVGGASANVGRAEILIQAEDQKLVWGSLCGNNWEKADGSATPFEANAFCRAVGFPYGGSAATSSVVTEMAVSGAGPMWYGGVDCTDAENFAQCAFSDLAESRDRDACPRSSAAFLNCKAGERGAVRLSGGPDRAQGRVDFYVQRDGGKWGSVCADEFDEGEAVVVCRQLGFTWGKVADGTDGRYGLPPVGQPGVLSKLRCTGDEPALGAGPGESGRYGAEDSVRCIVGGDGKDERAAGCGQDSGYAAVMCYSREPGEEEQIRVHGGSSDKEGQLQVYRGRTWGHLCDAQMTTNQKNVLARVSCRELGYATGEPIAAVGAVNTEPAYDSADCSDDFDAVSECQLTVASTGTSCPAFAVRCSETEPEPADPKMRLDFDTGRLEVYANGRWGSVCAKNFDPVDASVACRKLSPNAPWATISTAAKPSRGPIQLSNVKCDGTEDHLTECEHDGVGVSDCDHSQDVAVECHAERDDSGKGVRLASGTFSEGRVEVFHNNRWQGVCRGEWTAEDASVVCKTLSDGKMRYGYADSTVSRPEFDSLSYAATLADVKCTGYEASIEDCPKVWVDRSADEHLNYQCDGYAVARCVADEPGSEGQIRLEGDSDKVDVDGRNLKGVVRVYLDGMWRSVCDNEFDDTDASVACRQLGYQRGGKRVMRAERDQRGYQAVAGSPIAGTRFDCDGDEDALTACDFADDAEEEGCTHADDVAVLCYGKDDGEVAIVDTDGASGASAGVVKVRLFGELVTVCADEFEGADASVVCRAAGFNGGEEEDDADVVTRGAGNMGISQLDCSGSERDVLACGRAPRAPRCAARQAAGVRCYEALHTSCDCDSVDCAVKPQCDAVPANGPNGYTAGDSCTPHWGRMWNSDDSASAGLKVGFTSYDSEFNTLSALIGKSELEAAKAARQCQAIPLVGFSDKQPVRFCLSYSDTTEDYVVTFDRFQESE